MIGGRTLIERRVVDWSSPERADYEQVKADGPQTPEPEYPPPFFGSGTWDWVATPDGGRWVDADYADAYRQHYESYEWSWSPVTEAVRADGLRQTSRFVPGDISYAARIGHGSKSLPVEIQVQGDVTASPYRTTARGLKVSYSIDIDIDGGASLTEAAGADSSGTITVRRHNVPDDDAGETLTLRPGDVPGLDRDPDARGGQGDRRATGADFADGLPVEAEFEAGKRTAVIEVRAADDDVAEAPEGKAGWTEGVRLSLPDGVLTEDDDPWADVTIDDESDWFHGDWELPDEGAGAQNDTATGTFVHDLNGDDPGKGLDVSGIFGPTMKEYLVEVRSWELLPSPKGLTGFTQPLNTGRTIEKGTSFNIAAEFGAEYEVKGIPVSGGLVFDWGWSETNGIDLDLQASQKRNIRYYGRMYIMKHEFKVYRTTSESWDSPFRDPYTSVSSATAYDLDLDDARIWEQERHWLDSTSAEANDLHEEFRQPIPEVGFFG